MHDPLRKYPGYSLRRAANAMTAELSARLAAVDLRMTEASVLFLIGENAGVTSSTLGRQLDVQRANMVPLLKRLEDGGLIVREPIDRRSQGLKLTAAGLNRLSAARDLVERFERDMLESIPEEHRAHLQPALDALWR